MGEFRYDEDERICAPNRLNDLAPQMTVQMATNRSYRKIYLPLILRPLLSLALLFGPAFSLPQTTRKTAPKASPGDRKLASIKVTGSQRYMPDEIIAASGLK